MSGSVQYAIGSKNVLKICIDGDQFQMEIRKTSSRRPRSVDNAEIGHFTLLGSLTKPRRRRQRERHQTKGLMSRTMATHVRYKSLYISLPSPAKQQREMIKFCVLYRTRTTTANFCISIWNYKPPLHI